MDSASVAIAWVSDGAMFVRLWRVQAQQEGGRGMTRATSCAFGISLPSVPRARLSFGILPLGLVFRLSTEDGRGTSDHRPDRDVLVLPCIGFARLRARCGSASGMRDPARDEARLAAPAARVWGTAAGRIHRGAGFLLRLFRIPGAV